MDDINEAVRNAALHLDDILTQSHRVNNCVSVDAAYLGLILEALASTWPPRKVGFDDPVLWGPGRFVVELRNRLALNQAAWRADLLCVPIKERRGIAP